MESLWIQSSLWLGLALLASLISIRMGISVALIEIFVGMLAGNWIGLPIEAWVNYLAGVGAILLTFLAGAEIDPAVVRKHFAASVGIGAGSFLAPFLGCLLWTRYLCHWSGPQAMIAGIALSTTSVAVTYSVMVETGYNQTEMGKIILAACFVTDLGTVLALGILFANYNGWLACFAIATAAAMWYLPRWVPKFFQRAGSRISEPETKFLLLVLFLLGGLANMAKTEAVLPAYLIGMVLAPYFLQERVLAHRMRVMSFTFLTPFYFLKAGSLVRFQTILASLGLIALLLALKMATKFIGVWPLTRKFDFRPLEGIYTTLMMSTGLTFGTISALYGLNNGIINAEQYTILVAVVIGSAVVPTLIAQRWFQPAAVPVEEEIADRRHGKATATPLAVPSQTKER